MSKKIGVIRLNANFVGECNVSEDGERYIIIRHKFGVDYKMISEDLRQGFIFDGHQFIPNSSIGSIVLLDE